MQVAINTHNTYFVISDNKINLLHRHLKIFFKVLKYKSYKTYHKCYILH